MQDLTHQLLNNAPPPPPTIRPPDLSSSQVCLLAPPLLDTVPLVSNFGDVVVNVGGVYRPGERVDVTFR